jgi:hypothetical protein
MMHKAILVALAIAAATPAAAQPPYHGDWYSPGYGERHRWHEEERARERERIERERHRQIQCSHNPYHPNCYR